MIQNLTQELFKSEYWRQSPRNFKRVLDIKLLDSIDKQEFFSWCVPPASARLYHLKGNKDTGHATTVPIEKIPELYEAARGHALKITALLNGVELASSKIRNLQKEFSINEIAWRTNDVVCTLSNEQAGIGYHAGTEDGFVIQLRGKRLWKVWPVLSPENHYYQSLVLDAVLSVPPPEENKLVFECVLEPGDILYIPAFAPHQGLTISESISASIAWRGVTKFDLISTLVRDYEELKSVALNYPSAFFSLFPDSYKMEENASISEFRNQFDEIFEVLNLDREARSEICHILLNQIEHAFIHQ